MKKNLVTLLLALAIVSPVAAFAEESPELISAPTSSEESANEQKLETKTIESEADIEAITDEETIIIGKDGKAVDKLEKGDTVIVNAYENIVAVTPEESNIDIDGYLANKEEGNGEFINLENTLALKIGEDTEIVDLDGKTVSKDELDGKILVVYYGASTRSIPAQTTPSKIIVVRETSPASEEPFMTDVFVKSEEFGGYINKDNTLVIRIGDDTEIVDEKGNAVSKDDLDQKKLQVYYSIATASIPAQTTPTKIVVLSEENLSPEETVTTDIFIKSEEFGDYINKDNTLAIHIGDNTEIVDEKGNAVSKDDLHLMTLEVHYNFMTMSIPPQTTPTKIVVKDVPKAQPGDFTKPIIKKNVAVLAKGDKIIESEYTVKNEKNYVPFRAIAEGLGISVTWLDPERAIILEADDVKTTTKVDGNNDMFIEEGHTFVMTEELINYFGGFGVSVELN